MNGLLQEPHRKIEYDLDYAGGNYDDVGDFAYIPESIVVQCGGDVQRAFEVVTGHNRIHIVCTYDDERVTAAGEEWGEQDAA